MIKVSCVSYLNAVPFVYGLQNHPVSSEIELSLDIPVDCARKLIEGTVDVGLVPVAAIPFLSSPQIISNFCIGAEGAVTSVILAGTVQPDEMQEVLLDPQSKTSVALFKILAKEYWKIQPKVITAKDGYETSVGPRQGAVIIGDRALRYRERFPVVIDLAQVWQDFTGYPFVFAAWVTNRSLKQDFVERFNDAVKLGVSSKASALSTMHLNESKYDEALKYLEKDISYHLDEKKRKGLELFLNYLAAFSD